MALTAEPPFLGFVTTEFRFQAVGFTFRLSNFASLLIFVYWIHNNRVPTFGCPLIPHTPALPSLTPSPGFWFWELVKALEAELYRALER